MPHLPPRLLACVLLFTISITTSSFAQTTGQKQTAEKTPSPTTTNKTDASVDSSARSSPITLVGSIIKIRTNGTRLDRPGISVLEGVVLDVGYCVKRMEIHGSAARALKLIVEARGKSYTINLRDYRDPSLSIEGGATIKVTGRMVGNTVYAVKFETIKKPTEETFILTDIKVPTAPSPVPQ